MTDDATHNPVPRTPLPLPPVPVAYGARDAADAIVAGDTGAMAGTHERAVANAEPGIVDAFTPDGAQTRAVRRARAIQALDMRLMGATLDQIAQALTISRDTAEHYITELLRERSSPARIEDAREQELLRLDKLLLAWGPRSTSANPDPRAADIYLRIQERRSRLLGLDAPQRVDLSALVMDLARAEGWDVAATLADASQMAKALPPPDDSRGSRS